MREVETIVEKAGRILEDILILKMVIIQVQQLNKSQVAGLV